MTINWRSCIPFMGSIVTVSSIPGTSHSIWQLGLLFTRKVKASKLRLGKLFFDFLFKVNQFILYFRVDIPWLRKRSTRKCYYISLRSFVFYGSFLSVLITVLFVLNIPLLYPIKPMAVILVLISVVTMLLLVLTTIFVKRPRSILC